MSLANTLNGITLQTIQLAPALIHAAETTSAGGPEKQSAVVSVLTGIQVASGDLVNHPNPTVAATATLVNMIVSLFNALGAFKKK